MSKATFTNRQALIKFRTMTKKALSKEQKEPNASNQIDASGSASCTDDTYTDDFKSDKICTDVVIPEIDYDCLERERIDELVGHLSDAIEELDDDCENFEFICDHFGYNDEVIEVIKEGIYKLGVGLASLEHWKKELNDNEK